MKFYLSLATLVFFAATTGADILARISVANESLAFAMSEHFYYARVQFVGTLFLWAPFIGVAVVCGRMEKKARTRSVAIIFVNAMTTLLYFYYEGHIAKEHAMQDRMWTAATLSVGLLPFFVGIPLVLVTLGAGALAKKFDGRVLE